jgi:hypothetical protein
MWKIPAEENMLMKEGGIYTRLEKSMQWGTSWKELTKY